jgi:hypothetical protein
MKHGEGKKSALVMRATRLVTKTAKSTAPASSTGLMDPRAQMTSMCGKIMSGD